MSFIHRLQANNREKKWRMFECLVNPTPETTVLDVGFADKEFSPVDNYLERKYPFPRQVTALGILEPNEFRARYPEVNVVTYDGTVFPFSDKQFDVCWSNAVVEHVGSRQDQTRFLSEIARVSRFAFITTPNRYFPVELHTRTPFLHYLPKQFFYWYLRRIGKGWAAGSYMNLLSLGSLEAVLRDAGLDECEIIRNRMCGLTLEFIILIGEKPSASQ